MYKDDFLLADSCYLLNHSVGRPLKTTEQAFKDSFLSPWQESGREPWGDWLAIIENFKSALARLFNANADDFCPQVNLSSALTKIVMAHARLQSNNIVVLMSEADFPSMGFALQKSLPDCAIIRFINKELDITDLNVWSEHLTADVDLVFISNAYSNTGQLAPVSQLLELTRSNNSLSILDIAQSAGVIPLDLSKQQPDFMLGSSVKWLCGGPGSAYLWVNPKQIALCQPKDVGWFSHENPFEFDIHNFKYQDSAMMFWGGTPSIAPFALSTHSINYFAKLGSDVIRAHNQAMIDKVVAEFSEQLVSPIAYDKRSGTMILDFKDKQQSILSALANNNISVDARHLGMRVSPHIYNDAADLDKFIDVVKSS